MMQNINQESEYSRLIEKFDNEVTVYPVSCEKLANGRSDKEWLDGVLAGGARIVQLRDKESKDAQLLEKAFYFREKTREAGALFLVNDRLDIALLSGADGMHVGQGDMPPEAIRLLAPHMIIGLSCNSEDDAKVLQQKIDKDQKLVTYFNIGPLYPTGTKEGLKKFIGPEAIAPFRGSCDLPFTVMGGIKFHHVAELTKNGANKIAVVTALTQADDIAKETARWVEAINAGSSKE